ncbi:MAG: HAD family phosphatase [Candidatus Altiarchaeota archaeon]
MADSIKLVAFDLDGVLVEEPGSWMQVHIALGTQERALQNASDFFNGKITFEEWARKDVMLWRGVKVSTIRDILYKVPLMPGAAETLTQIKSQGIKIAIITGGLKILADRILETYGLDYSVGNELTEKNGRVTGVKKDVDFYGKGKILTEIAEQEGITTQECACIGDHINDIPMFKIAGLSIAFNPKDDELEKNAHHTIHEKKLEKILPILLIKQHCTSPAQT